MLGCAIAIALIAVLVYIIWGGRGEGFESKQEKASAIQSWFAKNPKHDYTHYKAAISADVVEYSDVMKVCANRVNCTVGEIARTI